MQILWVRDLVSGNEPGADWAEGVATLALVPLAAPLDLEGALRDVVDDTVPGDMGQGIGLADVLRGPADDDAEFDLPVGLLGAAGDLDVVIRPADCARGLHEEHRLARYWQPRLGSVVRVVQADADELADRSDAWADARRVINTWQRGCVHAAEPVEIVRQKRSPLMSGTRPDKSRNSPAS